MRKLTKLGVGNTYNKPCTIFNQSGLCRGNPSTRKIDTRRTVLQCTCSTIWRQKRQKKCRRCHPHPRTYCFYLRRILYQILFVFLCNRITSVSYSVCKHWQ